MQSQRVVRWVEQERERLTMSWWRTLCDKLTEEDWEGEGDMANLDGVYRYKGVNGNVLPYFFFKRMNCSDVALPRPLKLGWLT